MNNDPLSLPSEISPDATLETLEATEAVGDGDGPSRQKQRRNAQNKKRAELLDHLLRSLDIVIYCELATVYYMEYVSSP